MIEQKKIPSGWIKTTVGEILEFEYGKGLISELRDNTGTYPVFGSNGFVGNHTSYLIEGPCIIVGRKGAAGAVHYSEKHCWPIDTTYFIRKLDSLNLKFYYYLLGSLNLNSLDKSTAIPGLNRNDAYAKTIFLPPLPEQNRIVNKIEELFIEMDNGIHQLISAQKQLKTYRQAILKNAFEGKLTVDWRKINKPEPFKKLAARIKQERQNKYDKDILAWKKEGKKWEKEGKKGKKPKAPNDIGIKLNALRSSNLPDTWFLGAFEYSVDNRDGDRQPINSAIRQNRKGKYPYYGATEIVDYIDDFLFDGKFLLIGEDGANLLTKMKDLAFIVEGKFWVNNHAHVVEALDGLNIDFLCYYINSIRLDEIVTGTAQPKLTQGNLNKIQIPYCDIKEQNLIVNILKNQFAEVEKLDNTVADNIEKLYLLKKSILKKAFEGRLVKQNIADESAIELLKRIKNEKEEYKKNLLAIKKVIKPKRMKTNLTIKEVLKSSKTPLNAKDVWKQSMHKDNIEEFYSELKKIQKNVLEIKKGKESLLSFIE